jgi:hypothetical protein
MKNFIKLLVVAGLLSTAFAGKASAQVDVYITGSSAFRASVTNAIGHLLTSPQAAFVGSAGTGAVGASNQQLITGVPNSTGTAAGLTSGTTYNFHTSWSGSLAGLSVLTFNTNTAAPFLPDTVTTSALTVGSGAAGTFADGGNPVASSAATVSHGADGAFSDVYQVSTTFKTPTLVAANGGVVGVVPYVWVGNPDTAAFVSANGTTKFTNINNTQAKQLFLAGLDPAQLTGNNADDQNGNSAFVLPVGRNADSGTRFNTFAETGFNPVAAAVKQPEQYQVSQNGNAIDVSLYPAETLFPGTSAAQAYAIGNSGYSSGSLVATAMSISGTSGANSDNASYLLTYVGENDAATIVKAGGSYIAYNGVSYASLSGTTPVYNRNLVDEGVYTLWGYEHLYYVSGNANAAPLTAIAKQVKAVDAPISGEILSNMAVQRDVEGGPVYFVGPGGSTK